MGAGGGQSQEEEQRSKDGGNRGQMAYEAKPRKRRQTEASSLNPLIRDSGKNPLN